jgi:molecular chaperone IbpA
MTNKANFLPSALYKTFLGFDRQFDEMVRVIRDDEVKFPPYNVIRTSDDDFLIEIAASGFRSDDISVTEHNGKLKVEGKRKEEDLPPGNYLYRGIATRAFIREFTLADTMEIEGAEFEDGVIKIKVHNNAPAQVAPRQIEVKRSNKLLNKP